MHWSYMLPPLIISNLVLLTRYLTVRRRPANIPVRMHRAGKTKWSRGHAVWVHDVFAFRASPTAWYESLDWVAAVDRRLPTTEERRKLHRLGEDMAVATFLLDDGGSVDVAARHEYELALFGKPENPRDTALSPHISEAS